MTSSPRAGLRKASATPRVVEVPPLRYLMIDGEGEAAEQRFQDAAAALITLAYQLKFAARKQLGTGVAVNPLEGLFWNVGSPMTDLPCPGQPMAWRLLIELADELDADFVDEVRAKAVAKKGLPLLSEIRVQTFSEGEAVQVLHVGPYADVGVAVGRLRSFARSNRRELRGPHHEIYLNDPAKTPAEKLRTIVRFQVERVR